MEGVQQRALKYTVSSCSSHSASYVPENILEDKPSDQASRWSSDTNNPPQYLVLRLERPAVVTSLSFGKYEKTHVCNLKRFQVFGGLEDDSLLELLDSGLKNDNVAETFVVRHQLNNHLFPIRYLKVIPIQSWGPSFNFSIWYLSLLGDDRPDLVREAALWQEQYREKETIRLCLKHFRQQNYLEVFECLQKKTRIDLEHPLLTKLHNTLVIKGDYLGTEQLIMDSSEQGFFSTYMNRQQPKPVWTALILPEDGVEGGEGPPTPTPTPTPTSATGDMEDEIEEERKETVLPSITQPSSRGGHQLVMDPVAQTIYLFGGWDGNRDLSDFWVYSVAAERWTLLCGDTETEGGPPSRSCHKMVLDPVYRQIFVLGRYLERGLRDLQSNIKSDFFLYDITTGGWTQITDDTSALGGPSLIFDHQMCLDSDRRNIYVFGGQSLYVSEDERPSAEKKFSGLYVYNIPNNTWRLLWADGAILGTGLPPLRSRTGHSMLFNTSDRCLYVFGGQRKRDEYLNDFFTFHVDTGEVRLLSDGNTAGDSAIPAVGYTQRATIDCVRGELHVMTGLNKDKDKDKRSGEARVSNSFWLYEIGSGRWSVVYRNENNEPGYWTRRQSVEPRPRYAHQLVYDEVRSHHYMFGGNPGGREGKDGRLRLGDFWSLQLVRPKKSDFERAARRLVRTARFHELKSSPLAGLTYLQTELAACVNHKDKDEEKQFQLLAGQLFTEEKRNKHTLRTQLFDKIVAFFPSDMTQPTGNLSDLVPLESKSHNAGAPLLPSS